MTIMPEYEKYTKPWETHKSINMLRGLVAGLKANGEVSSLEAEELAHWCAAHKNLEGRYPFKELIPMVERALEDGRIDEDEKEDILFACRNITGAGSCDCYDDVASSLQYLSGLVHGIMADRELSDAEIFSLKEWLEESDFLAGLYPYDEVYSLIVSILADGLITEDERKTLAAFFGNLIDFNYSRNLNEADYIALKKQYSVSGICALCPEILFPGRSFVLTGESARAERADLIKTITELGGTVKSSVSKKTDYLVVGNAGNPCWAFSCYGRKIEDAIQLRKQGAKVVIVNENDFWDAVEDT